MGVKMFRSLDTFASTASVFHEASLCPPLDLLHSEYLSMARQSTGQQSITILATHDGMKSTRLKGRRRAFGEVLISGKGA